MTKKGLKVVSACDGIGCAHTALKRAGVAIGSYMSFEVDKYAITVNQHNHPETQQLGDLRLWREWDSALESPDLMIGSTPCQNLSCAGDCKGLEGEESRLFWDFAEMLKYHKPKYFVFENVASMSKVNKNIISEALGVEPIMINAALVSAQHRKRLFWTNIPGVEQPADRHIYLRDVLESGITKEDKAYCVTASYSRSQPRSMLKHRNSHVFELRPHLLGAYGKGGQGAKVYSVKGKSVCLCAGGGRGGRTGIYRIDLPDGDYFLRKLTPLECERLMTLPDGYTAATILDRGARPLSNTQRYKMLGNGIVVEVLIGIFESLKRSAPAVLQEEGAYV